MRHYRFRLVPVWFLFVVVITYHGKFAHSVDPQQVKGETQYNYLRHAVAVSNSGLAYGKYGSTLLGRQVVSRHKIWSTIDDFTQAIYKNPETLDWYVADLGTDGDPRAVTLNAGFSCLDVGNSNSEPISWWVAENLNPETNDTRGVGGINRLPPGTEGSFNDILARCLSGRTFEKGRRLVEHLGQHRGSGVKLTKPTGRKDKPLSLVGDNLAFERLLDVRKKHDPSDVVVYDDKTGIPVVVGLPFDSGFRIHAEPERSTEEQTEFRVPMTPLGAMTTHIGARLRETRVDRGESRTSNILLLLTVWASGLALLLAVWIMCKTISDTLIARSENMRQADVHSAVQGSGGWTVGEKAIVFANFAAVTILLTPIGQAIVEGNIDPRSAIEVHYGANVYYTDSGKFSQDAENPIAGAIFFVSSWITVRPLDDGFIESLTFSMVGIVLFAFIIAMHVTKRSSEIMRSSRQRSWGFSIWKLTGYLRMWIRSRPGRNVSKYKVFVKLRADAYPLEGGEYLEDRVKEVALMGNVTFRLRANTIYRGRTDPHRNNAIREAAREAAYSELKQLQGTGCIGLFARVKLDDRRRFRVATARTTMYQDAMDRNWEYVRRGASCESIEWYRTNGRYPPDRVLVLVQLGLLKYSKFISEVRVAVDGDECEYDRDGVRCYVGVGGKSDMKELMDGSRDNAEGFPILREVDARGRQPKLFRDKVGCENAEINWPGGSEGQYIVSYPGSSMLLKYFILESSDLCEDRE